jgi:hypothetical protein
VSTTMDYTNSAYRLLKIPEDGKARKPGASCRAIWAAILGAEEYSPELLIRLGKTLELSGLVSQEISMAFPEEADTCSHWSHQLTVAFSHQILAGEWQSFIGHIDDHCIRYLKIHARMLQAHIKTQPVDMDVLLSTRVVLDQCLQEIIASDLDQKLKQTLTRNLRKLIVAIDEFKITGTTGVLDSVEILMGHQYFDKDYERFIRESSIGKKVQDAAATAANIVAVAIGLPQIGDNFPDMIEWVRSVAASIGSK